MTLYPEMKLMWYSDIIDKEMVYKYGYCTYIYIIMLTAKYWRPLSTFREKRLAKKYYDKLFKEYCISDLSRYKENKVNI